MPYSPLSASELSAAMDLAERWVPHSQSWNIWPMDHCSIVGLDAESRRAARQHGWGLSGRGLTDRDSCTVVAEEAVTFLRRCLVPTSGYYVRTGSGAPRFVPAPDEGVMVFAGLWEAKRSEWGEMRRFAIVTTPTTGELAAWETDGPAVLEPNAWDAWLDPRSTPEALALLLVSHGAGMLASHAVHTQISARPLTGAGLRRRHARSGGGARGAGGERPGAGGDGPGTAPRAWEGVARGRRRLRPRARGADSAPGSVGDDVQRAGAGALGLRGACPGPRLELGLTVIDRAAC